MSKIQMALSTAHDLAERIRAELVPSCERIEVAGSVRRRKPVVGDIELVAVPILRQDLFGNPGPSTLDSVLNDLVGEGRLRRGKWGPRLKVFGLPAVPGLSVEVHSVTSEQWGVLFALATGDALFSKSLVTQRSAGGRLPDGHRVLDGRVMRPLRRPLRDSESPNDGYIRTIGSQRWEILRTPQEADFFQIAGGWVDPERRSLSK